MSTSGVLPAAMAIGFFLVNLNLPEVKLGSMAASRTPTKSEGLAEETMMGEGNSSSFREKGMIMKSYDWKSNHTMNLPEADISDPFFDENWVQLEGALKYINDRRLEAFWVDRLLLDLWHDRLETSSLVVEEESEAKVEDAEPLAIHIDRALVHLFHNRWEEAFNSLCLVLAPLRPWTAVPFWSPKLRAWFKAHPALLLMVATAVDIALFSVVFKVVSLLFARPSPAKATSKGSA